MCCSDGIQGKRAILIGIVAVTVMGIPLGVTTPAGYLCQDTGCFILGKILYSALISKDCCPSGHHIYVFIAFCGDFFSTLGTVLGVAGKAGMLDEDGNMPGIQKLPSW